MNVLETFAELEKLYESTVMLEKFDTRLAKVLGNTIMQTSNPSGQGKKYSTEIQFIKDHSKEYRIKVKSFIAVHHLNGNHNDDSEGNIAFVIFENHSKYHNILISIADEWLQGHPVYSNRYDTLDFLARVKQINTFIDACNKKYKNHPDYNQSDDMKTTPIQELPKIDIKADDSDYIKKMFINDIDVQKAIADKVASEAIKIIPLAEVRALMTKNKNKN